MSRRSEALMKRSVYLGALAVLVLALWAVRVLAQTAISANGVVESTSGGFKFPDGTVQATAAAGGAPVEDTGQTGCWDTDGVSRPCAGTGEDGQFQAGVTWPTPRFTDNGDGTVTDNLTGLIWLKDANCPPGKKTWQGALDWVVLLNTTAIACTDYTAMTFTDWRMPNIKELLSLVDYNQSAPVLPSGPFVNVQSTWFYWSSSSLVADPRIAWHLDMGLGPGITSFKSTDYFVLPVRGGQ